MSSPLIPRLTDWHGAAQLHPYFVCDVFTSQPLQGNQLGVFVDGRPFTPEQMQSLAREMNFAETVFLLPPREGGDVWIRIFAPESELPFAGHPVLGTAFVVSTALGKENVALETGAGLVPVRLELSDGRPVFGRMQQPIRECEPYERERERVRRASMNGRRWALEGGVGRAGSRRRDARCAFSSRDLSRSVASARASSRERVMVTPCPEGRTHPSRACVPSTSRVPMAMQYTDRYVYYGP